MQPVPEIPLSEIADDIELIGALPGVVDLRVHHAKAPLQRFRPGTEATHVSAVDLLHQYLLILGGLEVSFRAMARDDGLSGRRKLAHQDGRIFHVLGHARGHVRHDQSCEMLRITQRVLHSEHAAPRMSIQDEALKTECLTNLLDLFPVAIDRPERDIIRRVRESAAELVVVPETHIRLRQKILQTFEVEVIESRTAVEREYRGVASSD